ncbi:MAG: hypothetical protein Q4A82_07320 [Corynebacterium sp.]|nr:hypothetical protein [Corynebacterium sp.]
MVKWFDQIEQWFTDRGYSRRDVWYEDTEESWVEYSLQLGGLAFDLYIIPRKEQAGCYSVAVGYHVRVVGLKELHYALVEKSSFTGVPQENNEAVFATKANYLPDDVRLEWCEDVVWVEKDVLGVRWQALLDQWEHDLPMLWSALADADDVCVAVDESRYWGWFKEWRGRLFALLYEKRWDEALACVQSWTKKNVNPHGSWPNSGRWSAQEELDNAVKVVTEYVNQHREQDQTEP